MSQIFISYAREDLENARRIAQALGEQGWSVWWDREIPAGKTFSEVIDQALSGAECVVVLWSNSSINSDWVQEEAEDGRKRGILVPVFIQNVTPPIGFRRVQAADLTDWDGSHTSPTFIKLVDDISLILGPPTIREEGKRPQEAKEIEEIELKGKADKPDVNGVPKWMYVILGIGALVILALAAWVFIRPPPVKESIIANYSKNLQKPTPVSQERHFVKYSDGIVKDKNSGLEWIAGRDKDTTWNEADEWVVSQNVAGGGWRMPTIKELRTLYKEGIGERNMTPLLETTGWFVWSEAKDSFSYWYFAFDAGGESWHSGKNKSQLRGFAVRSRR